MTEHYVYLFHTKEFVDSKEPVYKIGKSTQPNFGRFNQYVEGTRFHFQMSCHNCHDLENKIIALFKTKYELYCGREYFKGNYHCMVQDICRIIIDEKEDVKFEEVVVVEEKVVDKIVSVLPISDTNMPNGTVNTDSKKEHICVPCGFSGNSRSNLTKHITSKKHIDKIKNPDAVIVGGFKCPNCDKMYRSNQGLWSHKKICVQPPSTVVEVPIIDNTYLHTEIQNVKELILQLTENLKNNK